MTQSILVADDEPSILLSLQFLLQKAGYEVRLAHNGEEVIQAVEQSTPDLLLLDAMMPQRDGYDVCQTIRADPALDGAADHHADGQEPGRRAAEGNGAGRHRLCHQTFFDP